MDTHKMINTGLSNDYIDSVIERYTDMLLRYCVSRVFSVNDRLYIVQDVLIDFLRVKRVFENDKHEKNWLYKVCDNKIKDFLRKGYRKNKYEIAQDVVAEIAMANDRYDCLGLGLLDKIAKLPLSQEQAMILHYIDGYNAREIAEFLGITQQTVWNLLSKARESLKI